MKVVRLSALCTGRLYPQEIFLVLIPVRGWVDLRTIVRPEGWFIHLVVCLTTGPKPLPKRALHIVRSRASSFKWEDPLLFLRSSNSFLRLLPCLPVTSISLFIFPSIIRCRRQFLRKMWPIQFAFHLRISCRIFLCSLPPAIPLHFSHDQSNWSFPSSSSTTFKNFPGVSDLLTEASKFQHHIKLCSKCSTLLCQWKIPMTPSGIEPATFRLVAQCLNQLPHHVPPNWTAVEAQNHTCIWKLSAVVKIMH